MNSFKETKNLKDTQERTDTYLGLNHDYLKECAERAKSTPRRPLSAEQMKAQADSIRQEVMKEEGHL